MTQQLEVWPDRDSTVVFKEFVRMTSGATRTYFKEDFTIYAHETKYFIATQQIEAKPTYF